MGRSEVRHIPCPVVSGPWEACRAVAEGGGTHPGRACLSCFLCDLRRLLSLAAATLYPLPSEPRPASPHCPACCSPLGVLQRSWQR